MAPAARRTEPDPGWGPYYVEAWQRGPTRLVQRAVRAVRRGGGRARRAVDLGCGVGQDSIYLARHGFEVLAIDVHPQALRFLRDLGVKGVRCRRTDLARMRLEQGAYDVAHASLSLPFVGPDQLAATLGRIARALRPGGVLTCHLFGERHEWNRPGAAQAFVARGELEGLLAGFRITTLIERPPPEHLYGVVARRR